MGVVEEIPVEIESATPEVDQPKSPSKSKSAKKVRFVETESESEDFEGGEFDMEEGLEDMPGSDQFVEVLGTLLQTEEGVTIPDQLQIMNELLGQHVTYMRRIAKAVEAHCGSKPSKK